MYKSIIDIINVYVALGYKLEYTNGSTLVVFDINGFYHVMIDMVQGDPTYYYAATLYVDMDQSEGKYMYMCKDFEEMDREIKKYETIFSLEEESIDTEE